MLGLYILSLWTLFSSNSGAQIAHDYIALYHEIAQKEMEMYGIPASITIAQGMLESDLGRSDLATKANNHFGIKCGSQWKGETFYKHDDDKDHRGKLIESCFRSFDSVEESYRAHSTFLADERKAYRYGKLFDLDKTDYKGWAKGLLEAGYATDKKYPQKLISLIKKYELFQYDVPRDLVVERKTKVRKIIQNNTTKKSLKPRKEEISENAPKETYTTAEIMVNRCKARVVDENTTIEEFAQSYHVPVVELLNYNDTYHLPSDEIMAGDIIFLVKKKRTFLGEEETHKVIEGESLEEIAQMYGIRIKSLRAKNLIPKDAEILVGETLYLKKSVKRKNRPKFRLNNNRKHAFVFNQ